jgi:hypothetical protein
MCLKGEPYVEITVDDNLIEYLKPHKAGEALVLQVQEKASFKTAQPISYHIHLPLAALNTFAVSGQGLSSPRFSD